MDLGITWVLALVTAYMAEGAAPPLPPEQGEHGLSDAALWDRIVNEGNPIDGMTFVEAVRRDPRRIEALATQRVLQPLWLVTAKLENPWLDLRTLSDAMRHAYLERNQRLREQRGCIDACGIAQSNQDAYRANSELLRATFELGTTEALALKRIFTENRADIRRAFRETVTILESAAAAEDRGECRSAWERFAAITKALGAQIEEQIGGGASAEQIDADIPWADGGDEQMGGDVFGVLRFDETVSDIEDEKVGFVGEHEEYIVTGHRAPSVALPEYRRMGGRVF